MPRVHQSKTANKENKTKVAPIQTRTRLSENYEKPVSGRESWWRQTIKETPVPGSYESGGFLASLANRRDTYSFKSDGRRLDPQPQIGRGQDLLPGAYDHQDLARRLEKTKYSYGFKNSERDTGTTGTKDKHVDIAPDAYSTEKHLSMSSERQPVKDWQFKSQAQRFPTIYFKPKEGPAPGCYEYALPPGRHSVSSSFKSDTARFSTSHTKVPGPGTYEKTFQSNMPPTISRMSRVHGVFFSSAFQA